MALRKHILLRFIISLIIIVVLIGGVLLVLVNCTPRQLKLADKQLTDKYTVDGLGVADVKFLDILKLIKSIGTDQDQNKIAPNAYSVADGTSTDAKFATSTINVLGTVQYQSLLILPSPSLTPRTLKETELAYALDKGLHQFYASPLAALASDYVAVVELLQRLDASVVEMSFTNANDKHLLKTVIKLNVSEYVADINQKLPFGKISDYVYCTLVNEISVGTDGLLLQKKFVSVAINDQNTDVSKIALDALLKVTATDDEVPMTSEDVATYVCALISKFCSDIGEIGSTQGGLNLGISGINYTTHELTFLP